MNESRLVRKTERDPAHPGAREQRIWEVVLLGRARSSLEAQVLEPITNREEMNLTLDVLTARLRAEPHYVRQFDNVFGEPPAPKTTAMALATFVRTQRYGNSAFNGYERGDAAALSSEAQRGLALFRARAGCSVCHTGPNFTDQKFHNTGVSWGSADLGRFLVTGLDADRGSFKTPTLRESARTAPYMHDGSIETIAGVVSFYSAGGRPNPHLDSELHPLGLHQQRGTRPGGIPRGADVAAVEALRAR